MLLEVSYSCTETGRAAVPFPPEVDLGFMTIEMSGSEKTPGERVTSELPSRTFFPFEMPFAVNVQVPLVRRIEKLLPVTTACTFLVPFFAFTEYVRSSGMEGTVVLEVPALFESTKGTPPVMFKEPLSVKTSSEEKSVEPLKKLSQPEKNCKNKNYGKRKSFSAFHGGSSCKNGFNSKKVKML